MTGAFWGVTTEEAIELIETHWPKEAIKELDPRDYIEAAKHLKGNVQEESYDPPQFDRWGNEIPIIEDYDDGFDLSL